jgi:DnaJ-class molecular chaperone
MPCRGTGKVISNLGGTPSSVTCPWCDGSGTRVPGIDAQSKWLQGEAPTAAETEDSAEAE